MAAAIFRENHAINAKSSGLSSYVTFAVAFPQSSGNSADARLKKEYGSVNPGRGGSIEADPAPADEEARVSTPRRATDAVSAGSRHVARHVDVSRFDAWRVGSREDEAAARAEEPIPRDVPRASPRASRTAGVTGVEAITNAMPTPGCDAV